MAFRVSMFIRVAGFVQCCTPPGRKARGACTDILHQGGGCVKGHYFLALGLLLLAVSMPAFASGQAEVVYDAWSGEFLYEKNADAPMKIASTTKLLTALVAAEELDPEALVEIQVAHTAVEGSKMYLRAGEKRTVRELLCGLLLASGNDAAMALADAAGGQEAFVKLMNEKAAALGCRDSLFENPAGLDGENHHATAHDLALIAEAAFSNDLVCEISGMRHAVFDGHEMRNHNKLLWKSDACIGGKTGYTKAAGRCLVSLFNAEGRRIIIVTLHDADDWQNHLTLFETYSADIRLTGIRLSADLPVVNGEIPYVTLHAAVSLPLRTGEKKKIAAALYAPHFFYAMPRDTDDAGYFELLLGGRTVTRVAATP